MKDEKNQTAFGDWTDSPTEEFHLQAENKVEKNKLKKQPMTETTVFNNQVAEDQGVKD